MKDEERAQSRGRIPPSAEGRLSHGQLQIDSFKIAPEADIIAMSFLKPNLGRNGHDASLPAAEPARPANVPTNVPIRASPGEARTRALGVLSAELERLADVYQDALRDAEERLTRALGDIEQLERRHRELERENAEAERKLRALRALLDDVDPSS